MAIQAGETERIRLIKLLHDLDGLVTSNATVTMTVTREDGSLVVSAPATYSSAIHPKDGKEIGWNLPVTFPELSPGEVEWMDVLVEVDQPNNHGEWNTRVEVAG